MKKIIVIIISVLVLVLSSAAFALVGHPASQISAAGFQTGDFSFDGKVGIGTTGPIGTIHLQNPDSTVNYWDGKGLLIKDDTTANSGIGIWSRSSVEHYIASLVNDDNSYLILGTKKSLSSGSVDALTIRGSGNVGIGTTNPEVTLHVKANSPGTAPVFDAFDTGTVNHAFVVRDNSSNQLFRVQSNGRVGIGTTTPSARLHVNMDYPGTVYNSGVNNVVTGVGTKFLSTFAPGDIINVGGQSQVIATVDTDTSLHSNTDWTDFSAQPYTRTGVGTILNAGYVGIGTTGPSATLDIVGNLEVGGNEAVNSQGEVAINKIDEDDLSIASSLGAIMFATTSSSHCQTVCSSHNLACSEAMEYDKHSPYSYVPIGCYTSLHSGYEILQCLCE